MTPSPRRVPHPATSGGSTAVLLLLIGLLLLPGTSLAQLYPTHVYDEADGLPNAGVQDIVQAPDGVIWIATRGGIVSYDGAEWRNHDLRGQLGSADRRKLLFSPDGRLWATGSFPSAEVVVLEEGSWRVLPPPAMRLPEAQLTAAGFVESDRGPLPTLGDRAGNVLVFEEDAWSRIRGPGSPVHDMQPTAVGLLVATGTGIERIHGHRPRAEPWNLPGLPPGEVLALAPEEGGDALWIVGPDWIGRTDGGRLEIIDDELDLELYPNYFTGFDAVAGPAGGLYFGYQSGLYHFRPTEGLRSLGPQNGLVGPGATALWRDREDNVWVGNLRGISKIVSGPFLSYTKRHGLLEHEVSAALERRDGQIVLGAPGGITFFDPDEPVTIRLDDDPLRGLVLDLAEDTGGTLWVAANHAGLWAYGPDGRGRWYGADHGLPLPVVSVLGDEGGRLWVGTGSGLFRRAGETFRPVELPMPSREVYVRRIYGTPDGAVWIATGGQGIVRVAGGEVLRITGVDDHGDNVYALHQGADGTLWAGTRHGLYELRDGALRPRVPSPTGQRPIYSIVVDGGGGYWFGTDRGVYHMRAGRTRHFGVADGLIGSETNRAAALLDHRGHVWFGTNAGVSVYRPEHDIPRSLPPAPRLLQLEAGGEVVPLDGVPALPPDHGSLTFHFSVPYFVDEARLRFRSRLEGAEPGWTGPRPNAARELRYSYLRPGRYRLHLQAVDGDGRAGPTMTSPWITVRAHLWERTWVRLLGVLAGGLLIGTLVWTTTTHRHARRLEAKVAERTADLRASREVIARDRERLSATLSSITNGVVATDDAGRIVLWNRAAERITGWTEEEMVGSELSDGLRLESGSTAALLRDVIAEARVYEGVAYRLLTRHDERRDIEVAGAPLGGGVPGLTGAVLAFRDVTKRRRMERNLARAERLEALGILAGGIAHDFNNLLTAIVGNVSLLETDPDLDEDARRYLADAREGGERARALTQQLLTFAKGGAPVLRSVPLAGLLRDTASFVFRGSPIQVELDLGREPSPVEADADQLAQVLENVLLNARQAMPHGGRVRISAGDVGEDADGDTAVARVRIEVADEGPGIPPEHLERIFDPYFSTKPEGTGLGLTIAHSIVDRHGGRLTVDSEPGSGTTLEILLPAADREPEAPPPPARERPKATAVRVLVMDDDDAVRPLLSRMLSRLGHECVATRCGEEALRAYEQARTDGCRFDVVILDLTVPDGMGGKETLTRLREIDPEVRAIVASGYSDDATLADAESHGFLAAVSKPFDLEEISAAVATTAATAEPHHGVGSVPGAGG